MLTLRIAFRNIFRNTRRSLTTLATIAIGAIAVLVFGAYITYLLAAVEMFASTNAAAQATSEPHTAAAVVAVDEAWSKAEDTGDAKYLEALLLPEYRSISSDGSTHDKAAIIAGAIRSARTAEGAAKTQKWLAAHPSVPVVEIHGDVAILTFILQRRLDPKPVMSCDIFLYRGGRWRALYSQHTEAGK